MIRLARFVLPVWSFGYGELKQRCSKVGLTNMCIRFPTYQVWTAEQTPCVFYLLICFSPVSDRAHDMPLTNAWTVTVQYMCRANRQHLNKIFLGFYQGLPIWRLRLLWAISTDWSSLFPFYFFLNIRDWCWKNLLQQIDFLSPFPIYFFSIPNNFSPIPNRKGRHRISLSI